MSMDGLQKPHVAVLAFPALGHYIPLLELSRLVGSQNLTVSFVTTPANVPRFQDFIDEALNCGIDLRLLVLPTPHVEGLPEGRESTDVCPPESHGSIFAMARKLQEPFDAWMELQFKEQELAAPPVCVVFDSFMGWARQSAEKFSISCVEFNPVGAFGASATNSAARSIMQRVLEKQGEDCLVLSLDLPRPVRFKRNEINQDYWSPDEMNPITKFVLPMLQIVSKGVSGMLLNTFKELESDYVEHLRNLTGKPVWAIGPLLPMSYFGGAGNKLSTRGKMADIPADELLQWLDSQKTASVVYVSFGSVVKLSKEQTKALARGLEGSKQHFVWTIKVTHSGRSGNAEYLPEGFLERTKDRGVVIWGWAPQLLILSHPSVGAFMSHCGWNSVLESLTLGVPIAGWPMFGEQFLNMRTMEEMGVGIQFCEHPGGVPDEEKVGEVLRQVLSDDKGKEMRTAAQKVKEMARKAVGDGGSSKANVQGFASEMRKLLKMRQEQSSLP
ncbi:hypothetical protein SUGI_0076140 [Cryptomeria japonica]|uniref:scopoletin glucosyltransferase n=1 Tax=Cryptomeria japonica TaxID=3369 RepID=UPI002408B6FE|nr:scopoletin glucosyltransferase [Cryptomeria japonica]GLJ07884.1 hypothetical protein SUGI_0076140 [Cryptomeria japonica]